MTLPVLPKGEGHLRSVLVDIIRSSANLPDTPFILFLCLYGAERLFAARLFVDVEVVCRYRVVSCEVDVILPCLFVCLLVCSSFICFVCLFLHLCV